MALKFKAPPNWPAPPHPDWRPEPGWQPDPAWGPAPEGWNFWVEQEEVAGAEASGGAVSSSGLGDDAPGAGDTSGDAGDGAPGEAPSQVPGEVPGVQPAGLPATGAATAGSYAASAPSTYSGVPGAEPPKKKTGLLVGIIGGITVLLLVLILALVLVVRGISENISGADYGSAPGGTSSSSESFSSGGSTETPVYSGTGDQIFDIEKPGGADSIAWLEYTFTGEDDYSRFSLRTLGVDGDTNGNIYFSSYGLSATGSLWVDASLYLAESRTVALDVEADGEWTVTLHIEDRAPLFAPGDTLTGGQNIAFRVAEGEELTVDLAFDFGNGYAPDFTLFSHVPGDYRSTVINTQVDGLRASFSVIPGSPYMEVESEGSWELKAH